MSTTQTTQTDQTLQNEQSSISVAASNHEPSSSASSRQPKVSFAPDVVDNERMGKKSSKVCCLFHGNDDSSDEDSSEDESYNSGKNVHSCSHKNAYERYPKHQREKHRQRQLHS